MVLENFRLAIIYHGDDASVMATSRGDKVDG